MLEMRPHPMGELTVSRAVLNGKNTIAKTDKTRFVNKQLKGDLS